MKTFNALSEEVTQQQLSDVEKFADRILAKFNVDIEFTRHFADRMNDPRNKPAVSVAELQQIFKKIAKKKAKDIRQNPDSEAVIKDIQKDLNLPVVISYNKNKEEFEVTTKTIMRKKDFKTSSKVITTEKTLTPAEIKKREEIAKAIEKDSPDMPMAKKMAIATATAKRVAEAKKMKDDPCWKDHEMVGTKTKNGKTVPNCVPKEAKGTKGTDMPSESTTEYGKSQTAIARKKQQAAMKPGEMDKLKRLKDMMKNSNKKESVELDEIFKPEQMSALKKAYSTVTKVDPSSPAYQKMKSLIKTLSKDDLEKVARAKIKFVSGAAATELRVKHGVNLKANDFMESVKLDEADGKFQKQWRQGAKEVKKGNITLVRGAHGAHKVMKGGKQIDDFSFDSESDDFEIGRPGAMGKKRYADSVDDIFKMFESVDKYTSFSTQNKGRKPSLSQNKLSSAEYQKAKKLKAFNKDDWKWNGDLYIRVAEDVEESTGAKSLFNLLEELKEGKKPVSQMTPAEKEADAKKRKEYKAYQKSKRNEELEEATAELYFDTYTAAVQHAKAQAEKKGFEVVEDDWFRQVSVGKGRPKDGDTTRHTLKLTKNGKPVRKDLSIQVYNRGGSSKKPYELNFYVS